MADGWASTVHPLDTERIITTLAEHRVRFALVGGIAAIVHGYSGATFDFDLVPSAETANLNRLGRALQALNAVVWADPSRKDLFAGGTPPEADAFGSTAKGLRSQRVWHLTSDAGLIDIAMQIDGVGDYRALKPALETTNVFGVDIGVASLRDIIRSKRAVARAKDLRALPELEDLLEQRTRR